MIETPLPAQDAAAPPRHILCAMRMPPDLDGHGGSQRAWRLLEALRSHGRVHFVLLFRDQDRDCVGTPLAPIEPLCASVTRINIAGWEGAHERKWGVVPIKVRDLVNMRSHEAPASAPTRTRPSCARSIRARRSARSRT